MRIVAILVAGFVSTAGPVLATDRETFRKKLDRSGAPDFDPKPKIACVCKSGGTTHNFAGHLVNNTVDFGTTGLRNVRMRCTPLLFDASGALAGSNGSCDTWELLPK